MDGNIGTWGEVELEKQIADSRTHPPKAQESKNSSSLKEGNAMSFTSLCRLVFILDNY